MVPGRSPRSIAWPAACSRAGCSVDQGCERPPGAHLHRAPAPRELLTRRDRCRVSAGRGEVDVISSAEQLSAEWAAVSASAFISGAGSADELVSLSPEIGDAPRGQCHRQQLVQLEGRAAGAERKQVLVAFEGVFVGQPLDVAGVVEEAVALGLDQPGCRITASRVAALVAELDAP